MVGGSNFAIMNDITITSHQSDIPDEVISDVIRLFECSFGTLPDANFAERVREKRNLLVLMAYTDEPVGFKIGYERYRGVYFSWLGGVHPGMRRRGIARKLLRQQHAWASDQGYDEILTESQNEYREMMILNLKEGFDVVGTQLNGRGGLAVLMRKVVQSSPY